MIILICFYWLFPSVILISCFVLIVIQPKVILQFPHFTSDGNISCFTDQEEANHLLLLLWPCKLFSSVMDDGLFSSFLYVHVCRDKQAHKQTCPTEERVMLNVWNDTTMIKQIIIAFVKISNYCNCNFINLKVISAQLKECSSSWFSLTVESFLNLE